MKDFTEKELDAMTLADAQTEVINAVYAATHLIEELEYRRKVVGNGHHARQKIARMAAEELARRWAS